jgi:hypothetical protein
MLVDLEDIEIFQGDMLVYLQPIASLKTADVLRHYDAEFGNKRIFETLPNYISRGVVARLSLLLEVEKSASIRTASRNRSTTAARRWNNPARGSAW